MAIVTMKKFTLLTLESNKGSLLKELQKFEDVHFKNLQRDELPELDFLNKVSSLEAVNYAEAELAKIEFAMTKIEPYVTKPKGLEALKTPPKTLDYNEFDRYPDQYDYHKVYNDAKTWDEKITTIKTEATRLKSENEALRTWIKLDVSSTELEGFKYVKHLIGTVNKVTAESFRANVEENHPTTYVEFLGNVKDDVVALILLPSYEYEEALAYFKTLGFSKLTLNFKDVPAKIVDENTKEIANLQNSQNEAFNKIKELASEYEKLQIVSDYYETLLERERACQNFLKMQTVLLIEGWVPDEDSQTFKDIVASVCGNDFYIEEEEVEKDNEEVPIKLKNNKLASSFEDVTAMFSMPKYNEVDPTPLLTPFYLLFFGFMLGDAGYGLVLLIATSIALKSFSLKDGTRRFVRFFFYLSFATIFAGFFYGSMFGFPFFTPIVMEDGTRKAILDSQQDVMTMMVLSIAAGVFQILFGIGIKGYMLIRDGKIFSAIFDSLFWIIALLSGIGWLLGMAGVAPGTVKSVSGWIFGLSLVGLAATQGRESPSLGGKIGSGLYAVYGLSSYVGDLVSYTRIAALALSGAYIAFSFNLMAGLIPQGPMIPGLSIGVVRLIFGGLIVIFGQTLGLGLDALGAYVHTCRLQYVEYFGKFYEGGGVPFNAFKLKNKYIKIKK